MTAPYNLTNVTGANNWADLVMGLNSQATNGSLGVLIVLAVFIIFFFSFGQLEFKKKFASAAWVTAVLTLFLSLLGIVSLYVTVLVFVVAAASIALLILKND